MNPLVESLRRLYNNKEVDIEKILELVSKGTIDEKEKNYILGKEE
jgi:hypothetical protein